MKKLLFTIGLLSAVVAATVVLTKPKQIENEDLGI